MPHRRPKTNKSRIKQFTQTIIDDANVRAPLRRRFIALSACLGCTVQRGELRTRHPFPFVTIRVFFGIVSPNTSVRSIFYLFPFRRLAALVETRSNAFSIVFVPVSVQKSLSRFTDNRISFLIFFFDCSPHLLAFQSPLQGNISSCRYSFVRPKWFPQIMTCAVERLKTVLVTTIGANGRDWQRMWYLWR